MKEKLLNHFQKIGPRRFVVGTVMILLILDVLNGFYFKLLWQSRNTSHKVASLMFNQMKVEHQELDPSTVMEVANLVDKSFDFFLVVILVNNLFFYFFYLRKKLWAQGYVLFYTLTAGILNVTVLFDGFGMGVGWFLFNLLTIPLYLYLWSGVKLLKNETTIPVPEKKAR